MKLHRNSRVRRQLVIVGDEAFISLPNGMVAIIDEQDVPLVEAYNWSFVNGVVRRRVAKGVHVLLADVIKPPTAGHLVDHRDGDPLNNRRSNLRFATTIQNAQNRKMKSDNSAGFKGVSKCKNGFRVRIHVSGKSLYVGRFNTPQDAARAYDDAARLHFGEFACVNFPKNNERKA